MVGILRYFITDIRLSLIFQNVRILALQQSAIAHTFRSAIAASRNNYGLYCRALDHGPW